MRYISRFIAYGSKWLLNRKIEVIVSENFPVLFGTRSLVSGGFVQGCYFSAKVVGKLFKYFGIIWVAI